MILLPDNSYRTIPVRVVATNFVRCMKSVQMASDFEPSAYLKNVHFSENMNGMS
jgi:hypothetical protein